jgi:hypothetical protein
MQNTIRRRFRQKLLLELRHVKTHFKTYGFPDTPIKVIFEISENVGVTAVIETIK